MNDTVIIALVISIPPTLAAIASCIASLRNGQKIEVVRLDVNEKMKAFLELTAIASKAEGKLEAKDEQAVKDAQ